MRRAPQPAIDVSNTSIEYAVTVLYCYTLCCLVLCDGIIPIEEYTVPHTKEVMMNDILLECVRCLIIGLSCLVRLDGSVNWVR